MCYKLSTGLQLIGERAGRTHPYDRRLLQVEVGHRMSRCDRVVELELLKHCAQAYGRSVQLIGKGLCMPQGQGRRLTAQVKLRLD
jgi:hypothetical protein